MKSIENVYPIAAQQTTAFAVSREEPLALEQRVSAYLCFLHLEYNYPRPLTLRTLLHRFEDEDCFDPLTAEAAFHWWRDARA